MKPQVGDLIHVPAQTYVYQHAAREIPAAFKKLEKPKSLLVVGENSLFYQVLMLGAPWDVRKKDIFMAQGR
jgi:hypothetical protein